ncbi:MAG: hypothetical protein ACK40G_09605 [Cytophagaceae bacterium]
MLEVIAKYMAVIGSSMLKFIAGPILGIASGLSFFETAILTILGMMATVSLLISIVGKSFRNWLVAKFYKNRKLFCERNRKMVRIWRNYGLKGVAFLTPVLFSPIGGTLLATSFGESKRKIFFYMLASSVFWSIVFTFIIFMIKKVPELV